MSPRPYGAPPGDETVTTHIRKSRSPGLPRKKKRRSSQSPHPMQLREPARQRWSIRAFAQVHPNPRAGTPTRGITAEMPPWHGLRRSCRSRSSIAPASNHAAKSSPSPLRWPSLLHQWQKKRSMHHCIMPSIY